MTRSAAVLGAAYLLASGACIASAANSPSSLTADRSASALRRALTPRDVLESVRIIDNPIAVSPSKKRFVFRTLRADVAADSIVLDLVSGSFKSAGKKNKAVRVARFVSSGLASALSPLAVPEVDFSTLSNPLVWLGDESVAFGVQDSNGVRQIVRVNLRSGEVIKLTDEKNPVMSFGMHESGAIVFNTLVGREVERSRMRVDAGFTIPSATDGLAVIQGDFSGESQLNFAWNSRWFYKHPAGERRQILVEGATVDIALPIARAASISPNGAIAIVSLQPTQVPESWNRYTDKFQRQVVEMIRIDRNDERARRAIQLYMVNMATGTARPLWNSMSPIGSPSISWSKNSEQVVIAPTFLPPEATHPSALVGCAAAVVEVRTGNYARLPIEFTDRALISTRFLDNVTVEIESRLSSTAPPARDVFIFQAGRWQKKAPAESAGLRGLRVEIHQDLETPPRVYELDPVTNRQQMVFDPNPGLTETVLLGRTKEYSGTLSDGHKWSAILFYPAEWIPSVRYPLLIQSAGRVSDEFTLSGRQRGEGLGPPSVASMPGRLLLQRKIAVATVGVQDSYGPLEGRLYSEAYGSLVNLLSDSGLVVRDRIGLQGFSRSGFHVEYALTHSKLPFAAAVVADNLSVSYGQSALANWSFDMEYVVGAPPFAGGLAKWLDEASGFNADKVSSPLLMIEQSEVRTSVMLGWELFSRLRHLKKPVEMYVMPGADVHGAHSPMNPRQILAVQTRTIDWFDFWLTGHEDESPAKQEQYEEWRRLRLLHR